ncbi:MAG: hypothetical protein WCT26_02675 [Candidatus Buchananbacteria bacterium]|jgi:hypothetical protein
MSDKNQEPIYPPNFDSVFSTLDKVTYTDKTEEQHPKENDPEQMLIITESDLKKVVKEAMAEQQNVEPAEAAPATAENTELPSDKTVGESIKELTEIVAELTDQVKAAVEVVNPAPIEETAQVPATLETMQQEVTAQAAEVDEKMTSVIEEVQLVIEEVQHSTQQAEEKAEEARAHVEAKLEEIKVHVIEAMATQVIPPAHSNGKLENIVAKHMTLLILIIIATGATFAVLYFTERTKNSQLVENHQAEKAQLTEKYEKTITEMTQDIRNLSEDLVSMHIVKNENIESAIEKKIEQFATEGMSKAQAIPRAYIDPQVIEEATRYMPASVLKQSYVKDLILKQLQDISSFAASGLQEESLNAQ